MKGLSRNTLYDSRRQRMLIQMSGRDPGGSALRMRDERNVGRIPIHSETRGVAQQTLQVPAMLIKPEIRSRQRSLSRSNREERFLSRNIRRVLLASRASNAAFQVSRHFCPHWRSPEPLGACIPGSAPEDPALESRDEVMK